MDSLDYKKVLVVDDEPDIRELIQDELEELGFSVKTAGDGQEALELLKDYPAFLVISDINMPNLNGVELLQRIQKQEEAKPYVVLLTGFEGYENDVLQKKGALSLIEKPFNFARLEELLDDILPGGPEK